MIAVIYARYSSDQQRQASIEDQVRICRRVIEQQGWNYLHAYTDRAISGATVLRPAYQALLEDATRGQFEVVVAEALDRLSRDREDVAGLLKRLRFAGVRLFTVSEGEIGELHVGLKGTMNALFLKGLADKTRRGLEGRVRQGMSGGGLCYGYDVVREHDARGDLIAGGRTINQTEAEVVRQIFTDFYERPIPAQHRNRLEPGGCQSAARHCLGFIIGRLEWNRLRYVKDPVSGKRISRLNDPGDWIVHEVPELRIPAQPL